jgi:hypothetical protein
MTRITIRAPGVAFLTVFVLIQVGRKPGIAFLSPVLFFLLRYDTTTERTMGAQANKMMQPGVSDS